MEVFEQKFPVLQYFELPPQIAVNKQWRCIWFDYIFPRSCYLFDCFTLKMKTLRAGVEQSV
jgi:hypothetical protein